MHEDTPFFYFFKNKELNELCISNAIRTFTIALIGIFIPIYLYQLSYSFSSIFFFFLFISLFSLIFLVPSSKISYRFGLKHTILFSMIPLIIFFLLLFSLEDFNWPLVLLAFFAGMNGALFWFPYHLDFSKFSKSKKRGKQIGKATIIFAVFAALGPIIGALVLTYFGFKALFIIASLLLIGSTIPLFLTKEIYEPVKFSLKGFFKDQKLKNILGYMGTGMEARMNSVVWPLFIFIFIFGEKYISLGAVSSLALFSSLIFAFIAGKFSDINRRLTLKIGTITSSIVWIARSFVITPIQVLIVDIFYGASRSTMNIPFEALNYDKTNNKNRAKIILEREIYIKLGGVIFLFILGFMVDFLIEVIRYGGPLASLMKFFF